MESTPADGDKHEEISRLAEAANNLSGQIAVDGNSSLRPTVVVKSEVNRVISIFSDVLGVTSITLNIAFLVVMRFLKDHSTAYHQLMQSLSVADTLASLLFLLTTHFPSGPFAYMTKEQEFILQDGLPYVFRSMPWMFFTGYLFTLTCLTVHQYVAVCKPWKYSTLITGKMMRVSLILVWACSSLQVVIPILILLVLATLSDKVAAKRGLYYVSHTEMLIWMVVFAIITLFNIILDFIVYQRIKKLKQKRPSQYTSSQETVNIKMKQDAFITVTLLLLASILCRLPFPLFSIVDLGLQDVGNTYTTETIGSITVLLLFVNFFADPIIYIFRLKEVRKAVRSTCNRTVSEGVDTAGDMALLSRGLSRVSTQLDSRGQSSALSTQYTGDTDRDTPV